ncbi:MAG: Gfo/Idh/MocA family oxidoreductase [Planctomycetales bacterium]|nr:Gfo/Idh/MocA family oxidoreductase [Planctomycetales bacterium]
MNKLRWGVLSTAKIAREKVIPAMQLSGQCEIAGICSRNAERAAAAALELGIPLSFGSYEEMLASPDIDAIYNPLPNHLHVPWSIRALEAGKHVLCEKPIGLNVAEAEQLADAAASHSDLVTMEAFMYRFHPQWILAKSLVQEGAIGQPTTIQSFFSYHNVDAGNIRNVAEWGGGALMDIGCYCISLSRFLFDAEPLRVCGLVDRDPVMRVDRHTSAILDFGTVTSTFTCSTQNAPYQRVHVFGDQGRIEIEIPFNAPPDRPCLVWHERGGKLEEHALPVCDQYTLQGDRFADAVAQRLPAPTPLADAIANMRVIEAVFQSAEANDWVAIA